MSSILFILKDFNLSNYEWCCSYAHWNIDGYAGSKISIIRNLKLHIERENHKYGYLERMINIILMHPVFIRTTKYLQAFAKYQINEFLSFKDEDELNCAICICNVDIGEVMTKLKWNHCFHAEWIETFAIYNNSCPICRKAAFKA